MSTTAKRLPVILASILFVPGVLELSAQTSTNTAAAGTTNDKSANLNVRPGFRMELVADEHLVESPAAMAFDERGRLFVAELRDYPASRIGATLSGRVRLLEDENGDGIFDSSIVFADNLDRPTAIACSRGGVFVASPSELTFLLDTNRDDIADVNRMLLNFNSPRSAEWPDVFPRSMIHGPDGRIYVALASVEGEVRNLHAPGQRPLKLFGGGFSFDSFTLGLRAEPGIGLKAQAFDAAGRRFFSSTSAALAVTVLSAAEAGRNPYAPSTPTAATLVPAPRTGAPSACLVYRGNTYSTNLRGQVFLGDPASSVVYLVTLRNGRTHPTAIEHQGSALTPLVTGRDDSFRPMQLVSGPDDLVYIADLHRKAYPGGESHDTDPDTHEVRTPGRIWRLVPATTTAESADLPGFEDAMSLISALGNSNAWIRSTASRLILERSPTNAAPNLRKLLTRARWPVTRLAALWLLKASGTATYGDLIRGMGDKDPAVRAAAVSMTVGWIRNGRLADSLWDSLEARTRDASPEVRLRVALALGSVRTPSPAAPLADLYLQDPTDVWMQSAVLNVNPESLLPLFVELVGEPRLLQSDFGQDLLLDLATTVGLASEGTDVSDCLRVITDLDIPINFAYPIITALAEGLAGRGLRLYEVDEDGLWLGIANKAQLVALTGQDERIRSEAVKVLGACVGHEQVDVDALLLLLAPGLPVDMQIPVMQALAQQGRDRDFEALTQRWHLWDPPQQLATLDLLLQSEDGADALLSAIADGTIPGQALTSVHMNLLRGYPVDHIRARAERFFGSAQPNRDALVSDFLGVLDLPGSVARGREVFQTRCALCHQSGPASYGPPLRQMQSQSGVQLVTGIIDPSRDITDGYRTTMFNVSHGRMTWGVARNLNAEVIELTTRTGTRRYLRNAMGTLRQADWSLMPDETATGLTRQDLADLVQFILSGTSIGENRP